MSSRFVRRIAPPPGGDVAHFLVEVLLPSPAAPARYRPLVGCPAKHNVQNGQIKPILKTFITNFVVDVEAYVRSRFKTR